MAANHEKSARAPQQNTSVALRWCSGTLDDSHTSELRDIYFDLILSIFKDFIHPIVKNDYIYIYI